jgi:hypothetical protein
MASSQQRTQKPRNTQMSGQLESLRRNIQTKNTGFSHLKFPSVNGWKGDGEDHINIWEFGRTELGQLLSVNFSLPFKNPVLGRFKSIRGLWVFVTTKEQDDALRNMDARHIRDYVKKVESIKVKNFFAIILDSCYHRIKQTKVLSEAVIKSELPFDCYSASGQGLRTRAPFQRWFVAGMEEVRKALKENRAPDLKFLMDDPDTPLYKEVAPWYYEDRDKAPKPRSENSLLSAILADSKGAAPKQPKAPKAPQGEKPTSGDEFHADPIAPVAGAAAREVASEVEGYLKSDQQEERAVSTELPGVIGSNMSASPILNSSDTSTEVKVDTQVPVEEAQSTSVEASETAVQ